jgi:DNA modification methylase
MVCEMRAWKGGCLSMELQVGRPAEEGGPLPLYTTDWGEAYVGNALELLALLPRESVDLVLTSPPFALARPKTYGNVEEEAYADWFLPFAAEVYRVLKARGSFVLELGWAYQPGRPVRSLYNIRTVVRLCRELNFVFVQEFSWYNPSKLPSPIEWVCKRRIRVKDSVSPLFWLAKGEEPKADWTGVRSPGSQSRRARRVQLPPGDLDVEEDLVNLLTIANTCSTSRYLRYCRQLGLDAHPARFPALLPQFFMEGLTAPGDLVLDFMAGSNSVGVAAERLGRYWVAFELRADYLAASALNFLPDDAPALAGDIYRSLLVPQSSPVHLCTRMGGRKDHCHAIWRQAAR